MIREHGDINGIYINKVEHKMSRFYADDTQLMYNGNRKSFKKSIQVVNTFETVSGLLQNAEKNTSDFAW